MDTKLLQRTPKKVLLPVGRGFTDKAVQIDRHAILKPNTATITNGHNDMLQIKHPNGERQYIVSGANDSHHAKETPLTVADRATFKNVEFIELLEGEGDSNPDVSSPNLQWIPDFTFDVSSRRPGDWPGPVDPRWGKALSALGGLGTLGVILGSVLL